MSYRIRKKFKWEGSHKLLTSYSVACQQIHGHSYEAELVIESSQLNKDGMVLDFGLVKNRTAALFAALDHKTVLFKDDPVVESLRSAFPKSDTAFFVRNFLVVDYNPTAENMCKDLCLATYKELLKCGVSEGITSVVVRIHETSTGWAEYEFKTGGGCK